MTGYRGADEQTAEAMRDGVYHTGDVALRDDDGYLTFVGRTDDVFKASDYRISPFELESALLEHPAVAEAAVVPSPDPVRLAVPKAFVALAPGTRAGRGDGARHPRLHARAPGAVQADPPRRVRRAAEDHQRQDPPRRAARGRDGARPRPPATPPSGGRRTSLDTDQLDRLGIEQRRRGRADADRTFPRWYSDPAIYDFELDSIFTRSWVIAGSLDRLAKSGDHLVSPRRARARPRHARARRRAARVRQRLPPPRLPRRHRGRLPQLLQCAYHAWTYELDGRLNRAPRAEAEPGFDKADFSLVRVSVDTWGPLVWVNPDPDAPPLREAYPGFEALAAEHGMDFSGYATLARVLDPGELEGLGRERQRVRTGRPCLGTSLADAWDAAAARTSTSTRRPCSAQLTVPNAKARVRRRPASSLHLRLAGELHRRGRVRRDDRASSRPDRRRAIARTLPRWLDPAFVASGCMYDRARGRRGRAAAAARPATAMVPEGRLMPAARPRARAATRHGWESFAATLGIET